MVKLVKRIGIGQSPQEGDVVVFREWHVFANVYCKWYLYWLIRPYYLGRIYKYKFYRWLNKKGIMQTPEACIMQMTDIPLIGRIKNAISNF